MSMFHRNFLIASFSAVALIGCGKDDVSKSPSANLSSINNLHMNHQDSGAKNDKINIVASQWTDIDIFSGTMLGVGPMLPFLPSAELNLVKTYQLHGLTPEEVFASAQKMASSISIQNPGMLAQFARIMRSGDADQIAMAFGSMLNMVNDLTNAEIKKIGCVPEVCG